MLYGFKEFELSSCEQNIHVQRFNFIRSDEQKFKTH